jgi:hypothetical protein
MGVFGCWEPVESKRARVTYKCLLSRHLSGQNDWIEPNARSKEEVPGLLARVHYSTPALARFLLTGATAAGDVVGVPWRRQGIWGPKSPAL